MWWQKFYLVYCHMKTTMVKYPELVLHWTLIKINIDLCTQIDYYFGSWTFYEGNIAVDCSRLISFSCLLVLIVSLLRCRPVNISCALFQSVQAVYVSSPGSQGSGSRLPLCSLQGKWSVSAVSAKCAPGFDVWNNRFILNIISVWLHCVRQNWCFIPSMDSETTKGDEQIDWFHMFVAYVLFFLSAIPVLTFFSRNCQILGIFM